MGVLAAQIAAADFRRHSQCAVNRSTSSQLPASLDAEWSNAPLEGDASLGVYHILLSYQRFTTEDYRRVEMRAVLEGRRKR